MNFGEKCNFEEEEKKSPNLSTIMSVWTLSDVSLMVFVGLLHRMKN